MKAKIKDVKHACSVSQLVFVNPVTNAPPVVQISPMVDTLSQLSLLKGLNPLSDQGLKIVSDHLFNLKVHRSNPLRKHVFSGPVPSVDIKEPIITKRVPLKEHLFLPRHVLLLQVHQSADIMPSLCGFRVPVNNFFSKTTRPRDMLFF